MIKMAYELLGYYSSSNIILNASVTPIRQVTIIPNKSIVRFTWFIQYRLTHS